MSYEIKKRRGSRPWKIINTDTKKVVGSSVTKDNAIKSVIYRKKSINGELVKPITNAKKVVKHKAKIK